MKITAEFVTSAAGASGFPTGDLPEIALVGRSNVGKSSLINALTRRRLARTSGAPGKTRLVNIYRVARGSGRPLYLVDLPGFGYARGGGQSSREFEELTAAYFGRARGLRLEPEREDVRGIRLQPERDDGGNIRMKPDPAGEVGRDREGAIGALLLVDARHPGLDSDRDAWGWLKDTVSGRAIVATKIDKLARGQRIRALRELESVFEHSVLPTSAVTGEGLSELWNLIDTLANKPKPQLRRSRSRNSHLPKAMAPRPPKN